MKTKSLAIGAITAGVCGTIVAVGVSAGVGNAATSPQPTDLHTSSYSGIPKLTGALDTASTNALRDAALRTGRPYGTVVAYRHVKAAEGDFDIYLTEGGPCITIPDASGLGISCATQSTLDAGGFVVTTFPGTTATKTLDPSTSVHRGVAPDGYQTAAAKTATGDTLDFRIVNNAYVVTGPVTSIELEPSTGTLAPLQVPLG